MLCSCPRLVSDQKQPDFYLLHVYCLFIVAWCVLPVYNMTWWTGVEQLFVAIGCSRISDKFICLIFPCGLWSGPFSSLKKVPADFGQNAAFVYSQEFQCPTSVLWPFCSKGTGLLCKSSSLLTSSISNRPTVNAVTMQLREGTESDTLPY